ncbi:MAG: hypothetical protein FJ030_05705 [Chloroflexi bacterium]|nr:hypothetical protein [Chloroflexota bacterium]
MKKAMFALAALAMFVAACGSSATQPSAATVPPAATQTPTVVQSQPAESASNTVAAATQAPAPTAAPAVTIKTDFTPTDPSTVNLALGKPQLIEFYAVW